jgi:AcrR family transcriptional regulator
MRSNVNSRPKRIRRTAEDARRQILDAAEARLARTGPAGIRLQDVAADVGISHPAILHHFGNREGLILALTKRAVDELKGKLLNALASSEMQTVGILGELFNAFRHGLAQRLAWLALTGATGDQATEDSVLLDIVTTIHKHRLAGAPAGVTIDPEDTKSVVYLAVIAAFGDAIFGPQLRRSAGLPVDERAIAEFQSWFATLLRERLTQVSPSQEA